MKTYTVQKGDTLSSIAAQFRIIDGANLRAYHNAFCPLEDLLGHDVVAGKQLLIPDDPKYLKPEAPAAEEKVAPMNGPDGEAAQKSGPSEEKKEAKSEEKQEEKKEQQQQSESGSSEHDGKYFVVQKGMCQCDQGFKFPKFKVSSHKKHYWNDADGQADYLAVTEDDLQLDPPAQPFGQCKLQPSSSGYLPCTYAPAGKWTKTYEKVKVMDKKCVTELSELMCSVGGKITIFKHGQQSQAGKSNAKKANAREQRVYNPVMNFGEFQDENDETYLYDYE